MAERPTTPRIAPLHPDDANDFQRQLLTGVAGVAANIPAANIFATLVRHPGLFRHWLPFGGKLLAGKLPARDREILILRTGWQCQSEYEWGQHVVIGKHSGLTDDEIARIPTGPDGADWSAADALLLRAADELHHDSHVSDTTWKQLADQYNHDDATLIEIPMVVGHYHLVAMTLNTLGVQREEGVPSFPNR